MECSTDLPLNYALTWQEPGGHAQLITPLFPRECHKWAPPSSCRAELLQMFEYEGLLFACNMVDHWVTHCLPSPRRFLEIAFCSCCVKKINCCIFSRVQRCHFGARSAEANQDLSQDYCNNLHCSTHCDDLIMIKTGWFISVLSISWDFISVLSISWDFPIRMPK